MFENFEINIGGGTLLVSHDMKLGVINLTNGSSPEGGRFTVKGGDTRFTDEPSTMVCTHDELAGLLRDLLKVAVSPEKPRKESLIAAVPGVGIVVYRTDAGIGVIGKIDGGTVAVANLLDSVEPEPEPHQEETCDKTDPKHYQFPGGTQVIDITQHLGFLGGNVVKYVSRAGRKDGESPMDDLLKAQWYLNRLIEKESGQ